MSIRVDRQRILERLRRRRRRLRALLARMPRRSNIERYPVLRRFAGFARGRPFLWSYRRPNLTVAIYAGAILAMMPMLGIHALIAFPVAWLLRANLAVTVGLQLVNNFVTAAPLVYLTYRTGAFLLRPLHGTGFHPLLATALGVILVGTLLGVLVDVILRVFAWRHRRDLALLDETSTAQSSA